MTLLALVPLLGLPVAMVSLGRVMHRRSQEIQAQFSELTSHAHENLSGVRVVRSYRQERAEIAHFRALNDTYLFRNLGLARVQGAFFPLLTLLGGLSGLVILYAGSKLVMEGAVSVGQFVAFGVYLAMLVWPMIALGWAFNLVQRGAASMGRINQLFRERPAITSPAIAHRTASGEAAPGRSNFAMSGSATRERASAAGCCRTSPSASSPDHPSPSSAPPAPGSLPWWT